jgi:hypothetical protein
VITKTQITAWGVFYQQGILLSLAIGLVGTTVFDVHSCRDVAKDGMLHLAGHILAPFMVILSATIGYCIVVLNAAGTPEAGAPTQLGIMATALLYTTIAKMHVKHASYSARQRELAEASRT